MFLQRHERALRFLEVTAQEQEDRPAGRDRALHLALKNAAGAGGVAVKIYRGMRALVRCRHAESKILLRIAAARIENRKAQTVRRVAFNGPH